MLEVRNKNFINKLNYADSGAIFHYLHMEDEELLKIRNNDPEKALRAIENPQRDVLYMCSYDGSTDSSYAIMFNGEIYSSEEVCDFVEKNNPGYNWRNGNYYVEVDLYNDGRFWCFTEFNYMGWVYLALDAKAKCDITWYC